MEDLRLGNEEKDDDDDDGIGPRNSKKFSLAEALKPKPETRREKDDDESERASKERLLESHIESDDVAPELDAEAPLEHLSRVEAEAIAQTIASERLSEIQEEGKEDVTSESLAAETFLENVEASGDIDVAYHETMVELGEAALGSQPEAEIAEPVDPESLVQAAKSELSPDISYRIRGAGGPIREVPRAKGGSESNKGSRPEKAQKLRIAQAHSGVVEYIVGRRVARLKQEANRDELENRLENEVKNLQVKLVSRETHVREVAQNRTIEKKPAKSRAKELKPEEAETIGKVLINSKVPEHITATKGERAGISAHTMKHVELLQVAQKIKVEGASLRQIYETHLVGEKGLRRIVAEYLRGGNFKKVLRRELLEKEKDFERDPMLRDQASSQSVATEHNELDTLLKRSGIDWNEPQPVTANEDKVKGHSLPALIEDFKSSSKPIRRAADVVMLVVIVAMAVVIAWLLLGR